MNTVQICILVISTLLASFIKGGMGMGAGIFLLPTLALVFTPFTALALSAPILFFTDIMSLIYYWREWMKGPIFLKLLIFSAIGAVLGVAILPYVPVSALKILVGMIGVIYGVGKLFPSFFPIKRLRASLPAAKAGRGPLTLYVYPLTGGLINSLANAGGIFFVMCLMALGLEKRTFVATILSAILITSVCKVVGYYTIGILPFSDLKLTLILAPLVAGGCWLGNRCNQYLNPDIFAKCILWLILVVSVKLLLPM